MEFTKADKFGFIEMEFNRTSLNGIPFHGIPFLFPFADRTYEIPQACNPLPGICSPKSHKI